ncbi:acyltransferase family protein [Methylibium sp.]|uniref:acyltransferase family protein n=1 Tax=Methylibium sp. TaxID=2067992 RepID=UPI003BABA43F
MSWLAQRFELSRGGEAANVRPMEGLRGFAVLLVFLTHYAGMVEPWIAGSTETVRIASGLRHVGHAGVDLFFVLSGYLIYGSLMKRPQPFIGFMRRRVARIYPAFIVVFIAYVLLSFAFPSESRIPADPAEATLYLVQNLLLLPGLFPIDPLITVAWSLSYEMLFYLVTPALVALLGLRGRSRRWRVVFLLAGAGALALHGALQGGPIRLMMFIAGMLLHEALVHRLQAAPASPPGSLAGLLALLAGLGAVLLPGEGHAAQAAQVCILFVAWPLLCLVCFGAPSAWLPRTFSWTPLRWLGNMSYSYYLLHGLVLNAGFLLLAQVLPPAGQGAWVFWGLLPVLFGLTLLPTAVLFLLVERPYSLAPSSKAARTGRLAQGRMGASPTERRSD